MAKRPAAALKYDVRGRDIEEEGDGRLRSRVVSGGCNACDATGYQVELAGRIGGRLTFIAASHMLSLHCWHVGITLWKHVSTRMLRATIQTPHTRLYRKAACDSRRRYLPTVMAPYTRVQMINDE